jgi:hypothetical protein
MSKKWDEHTPGAKASWRIGVTNKEIPGCDTNNLDTWLALDTNERAEIAMALLDNIMRLSDDIPADNRYLQIGTTQNKSNFVFSLKGSNNGHGETFSQFENNFVDLIKKVVIKLEELYPLVDNPNF